MHAYANGSQIKRMKNFFLIFLLMTMIGISSAKSEELKPPSECTGNFDVSQKTDEASTYMQKINNKLMQH